VEFLVLCALFFLPDFLIYRPKRSSSHSIPEATIEALVKGNLYEDLLAYFLDLGLAPRTKYNRPAAEFPCARVDQLLDLRRDHTQNQHSRAVRFKQQEMLHRAFSFLLAFPFLFQLVLVLILTPYSSSRRSSHDSQPHQCQRLPYHAEGREEQFLQPVPRLDPVTGGMATPS
jgi:hypothetical protein